MKSYTLILAAVVSAGILVGCDKGASTLPSKGAVVVVGSHTLTDEMVKSRVALMQTLRLRKNPKMTAQDLGKFREMMTKSYPQFFVANAVQEDYAAKEGLKIPEAHIATNRQTVFRAYRARGEKTYDDMLKNLGESAAELESQVRSEALAAEVKAHFLKLEPPDIKPDYADKEIAKMLEQNRIMALTNTLIFARATNVWEQLRKGGDFAALAEQYTEIAAEKEDKGYWGTFDKDQLSHEPALVRFGRKAKPGEYTAPIEADNGLMILRLNEREKDEAGVEQFNFSRIFFLLPEFYLPAPKDAILRAARERYANALYDRKLKGLINAAKPVYRDDPEKKLKTAKEGK